MAERRSGRIRNYFPGRSYGFIELAEPGSWKHGRDVFFKEQETERLQSIRVGDEVFFAHVQQTNLAAELEHAGHGEAAPALSQPVATGGEEEDDFGGQRFLGSITVWFPREGFGLMSCQELEELSGNAVIVGQPLPARVSLGKEVAFAAKARADGFLQAVEVEQTYVGAPRRWFSLHGVSSLWFQGEIVGAYRDVYLDTWEYGFVSCQELQAIFERDAYISGPCMGDLVRGDYVSFKVYVNERGQLQAFHLEKQAEAPPDYAGPRDLGEFTGRVDPSDEKLCFGFVSSGPLWALFGRKVFAKASELEQLGAGDAVAFRALLHSHGLLEARDLRAVGPEEPPQKVSAAVTARPQTLLACADIAARTVQQFTLPQLATTVWSIACLKL